MFRIIEIRTYNKPDFRVPPDFIEKQKEGTATPEEEKAARKMSRYNSVMKVLKPNQRYILSSADTPMDFFNANGMPKINVSVIVGENGMGKSSLIDLIVRILNNTAYALKLGLDRGNDEYKEYKLRFVKDIYASITFEHSKRRYSIIQLDSTISFRSLSNGQNEWVFDFENRNDSTRGFQFQGNEEISIPESKLKEMCKKWLMELFYTIEINYSAYGNNTLDITPEYTDDEDLEIHEIDRPGAVDADTRIWMHNIFHKNDSYQLPLVVTPFRSNGRINYNNEQDLNRDRLIRLSMMNPSPLDNLIVGKKPDSILFDINSRFSCEPMLPEKETCVISQGLMSECRWLRVNSEEENPKPVNEFCRHIISLWCEILGEDLTKAGSSLNQISAGDGNRALSYLVYKTIKIARTYAVFHNKGAEKIRTLFKWFEDNHDSKNSVNEAIQSDLKPYLRRLMADDTHVTLKLRRTLAWLSLRHYTTKEKEISLQEFNNRITDLEGEQTGIHAWEKDELLPCPAVRSEVLFKTETDSRLRASSLSSGERQMLAVLATAIYHLYNLKTLVEENSHLDGNIFYPYVNLIFDEAELYFHPKYQTQFLNALLIGIKGLNLTEDNKIHGINMIFATHSPFLLSDVPKGNILCLKNGEPYSIGLKRTFCANVYDILAEGFFMTRFIGDFAYRKLGQIIDRINTPYASNQNIEDLRSKIDLIGDDFIRNSLKIRYGSIEKRRE